ncbi:protein YgfX [Niveibacterium sp.]|uniref:protein YgfX n=1 Tax=Niveibacterium sp. TaxID=2017444 RepID=UPI0035ADBF95
MRLAGEIRLRASLLFGVALVAFHVTALLLLFYPGVDGMLRWFGIPIIAGSAFFAWRRRSATGGASLRLHDDGSAEALASDGQLLPIVFCRTTRDGGWFLALCWQELATGKRHRLWLVASAMPASEWRLLRAWLRWRAFSRERISSEPNRTASADS